MSSLSANAWASAGTASFEAGDIFDSAKAAWLRASRSGSSTRIVASAGTASAAAEVHKEDARRQSEASKTPRCVLAWIKDNAGAADLQECPCRIPSRDFAEWIG